MTVKTRMSSLAVSEMLRLVMTGQDRNGQAVFQTVAAATGNERRPMFVRRHDGTNSSSVDDDRRRRRPDKSDTGTS